MGAYACSVKLCRVREAWWLGSPASGVAWEALVGGDAQTPQSAPFPPLSWYSRESSATVPEVACEGDKTLSSWPKPTKPMVPAPGASLMRGVLSVAAVALDARVMGVGVAE